MFNKNKQAILIALAALALPALSFAAQQFTGEIVDHLTRKPVANVDVRVIKEGATESSTSSTSSGRFKIQLNDESALADYIVILSKDGYPDRKIDPGLLDMENLPKRMRISMGDKQGAFYFKGNALQRDTGEPIQNANVSVINKMTGEKESYTTDYEGNYSAKILSGYEYLITVDDGSYLKRYAEINFCGDTLKKNNRYCFTGFSNVSLDPNGGVKGATVMLDKIVIGKKFKVDNIYYDYNKATLRHDGLPNLDKLYFILEDNPNISVELGSHADSRGSDSYNLSLSQRRAESAVNYIVKKGVEDQRITAKGYGETILVNECKNGVKCSDKAHEENRRTEFTITDITTL